MIGFLLFLASLTLIAPAETAAVSGRSPARLRAPEEINRGDVVRVLVEGRDISSVHAYLELPDGRRTEGQGQRVATGVLGMERWQVLVGVDHSTDGGTAQLSVVAFAEGGTRQFLRDVEILPRSFPSEEIALNRVMSDLRETVDPRRTRESRELWEVLTTLDPLATYETGSLSFPMEDFRLTSTFGDRRVFRYADGRTSRSYHHGIDMAAPTGAPVYAPARGRVVMATDRLITGGTIVLEHQPGVFSLYYHLHTVETEVDRIVARGSRIGTVGATGLATGPHLHWEVRIGGVPVDPEWFVREPLVDTSDMAGALFTLP